jgi:cytochrome P450
MVNTQHAVKGAVPAGPRLTQMLRLVWRLQRRGDAAFDDLFERYGDVVWVSLPTFLSKRIVSAGSRVAFVRDPKLIKPLLMAPAEVVNATEPHRMLETLWGDRSLFILDGPPHRRLRKLMLPRLRGDALEHWREFIATKVEGEAHAWVNEPVVTVLPRMQDVSLELILKILASVPDSEMPVWKSAWRDLLKTGTSGQIAMRSALRSLGAMRLWPRYHRELQRCERLIFDEVVRRRRQPELEHDDIIDLLMRAEGEPVSDKEIRDQVFAIMIGGYDPPAALASWVIERLVRNPHALAAATAEARGSEGQTTYMDAVVQETLRLRPPFMFVARLIREPITMGEHHFPAGTMLMVVISAVHRQPELYDDPESFRPERFLQQRPTFYGHIPFGGGEHRCLGDRVAVFEVTHTVATLLRLVDLEAVDPRDERVRIESGVRVPGNGGVVRARRAYRTEEYSDRGART